MINPDPVAIEVFVYKHERFLGSRCYSDEIISIGCGKAAGVKLMDHRVSTRHAEIEVRAGVALIRGINGEVLLNGRPVESIRVSPADEITVGPFRLKISVQARAPSRLAPGDADVEVDGEVTIPRIVIPGAAFADEEPTRVEGARCGRNARAPKDQDSRELAVVDDHQAALRDGEEVPIERPRITPRSMTMDGEVFEDSETVDAEDDDDEDFEEPFSLLENIVKERFQAKIETEPFKMAEVIEYRGQEITNLLRADPGQSIKVGPDNFCLLTMDRTRSRAVVYFEKSFDGSLVRDQKARPLKRYCVDEHRLSKTSRRFAVTLAGGDFAQLNRGKSGYLVRFVSPPAAHKHLARLRPNWSRLQVFAGSAALHFLALVLLGFVSPEADLTMAQDKEVFVDVRIKDLKLERPEDPKEPKQEKPKANKKSPAEVAPRRMQRHPRKPGTPRSVVRRKKQQQKKAVSKVLSALENIRPAGDRPGRSTLKSMVSSIAAVRSSGGGGFKVAGVIGKIAGGGVRLAGGIGGGGGSETHSGRTLLASAGSGVGTIRADERTGTRIRGRVKKPAIRAIKCTGGVLDRGKIQRVVMKHMREIQRCYEVQLLKDPSLQGTIVFDWVISGSGGVSSARQFSSTMRSSAVSSCILSRIRRWRFPQPAGGSVKVRYPFVFRRSEF